MKFKNLQSDNRGFALLFAVLTSSVLLSIGASIFNLTLKELVLSSSGRESQFAFYAADTGVECALYWDTTPALQYMFATSTDSQGGWRRSEVARVRPQCIGANFTQEFSNPVSVSGTGVFPPTPSSGQTAFSLTIPNPGGIDDYCVDVTVFKEDVSGSGNIVTTIDARGYNTCDTTDPTRVERGLRVTY